MPDFVPRIDVVRALEKAARTVTRFMPSDMERERIEILGYLKAAIHKLGPMDDHRVCRRCGKSFIWTVQQQEHFAASNLRPPRHCKRCREARRQERRAAGDPVWRGDEP
jgi:hypothetical protein